MAHELYTFDSCLHFRVAYGTYDMHVPCRHKEGHQECARDSNCQYCINWSDIKWSVYDRNLQRKGKRRQKKLDKMQRQSLQKTPWQLALKIQKTWQQKNCRWKILEVSSSLFTRVPSKRIAVPVDTDHKASPALTKRLKRDDDSHNLTRTGIAIAIGVRILPTGKDILTNGQVPKAAREVRLVRAPYGATVPNPELTMQLELVPLGMGLLWTKVQLESAHDGAGLPWTEAQLESVPPGTGLLRVQLTELDYRGPPSCSGFLRGPDYHIQAIWTRFLCEPYF